MKRSDRWLLGLEVGLVLGLGWVLVQAAGALSRLNDNSPITRYTPPARATASPTARLRVVALLTSAAVITTWNPTPTLAGPLGYVLLVTSVPVLPIVPPTPDPPAGWGRRTGRSRHGPGHPTDTPTLTLISCYPYRIDTQRIIVVADLATG